MKKMTAFILLCAVFLYSSTFAFFFENIWETADTCNMWNDINNGSSKEWKWLIEKCLEIIDSHPRNEALGDLFLEMKFFVIEEKTTFPRYTARIFRGHGQSSKIFLLMQQISYALENRALAMRTSHPEEAYDMYTQAMALGLVDVVFRRSQGSCARMIKKLEELPVQHSLKVLELAKNIFTCNDRFPLSDEYGASFTNAYNFLNNPFDDRLCKKMLGQPVPTFEFLHLKENTTSSLRDSQEHGDTQEGDISSGELSRKEA